MTAFARCICKTRFVTLWGPEKSQFSPHRPIGRPHASARDGVMPLPPLERESENLFFSAFTSETEDREDHSFSGVFFAIGCDSLLPVSRVEVRSLSVRGDLGRVRVYVKAPVKRSSVDAPREPNVTDEYGKYARRDPLVEGLFDETAWGEPRHDETHQSSREVMVELKLNKPIVLERGEMVEVYVHSDVPGDSGLVYDDATDMMGRPKCDGVLQIYPGFAHLSREPFGKTAPWYAPSVNWVTSLRRDRRFVGKVSYGVRWLSWQPEKEAHEKFPVEFQEVVRTMLRGVRDEGSALSALHPDVLMYIFNKHVGWEWFGKDVPARQFPALATSCRSRSVNVMLDVIIDHMREYLSQPEHASNLRVMVVACQMVRTIVSNGDALRLLLAACSMNIRIRALLHMVKSCYEKISDRKGEMRCEQSETTAGQIPPRLLVECIPEALAYDVTTVNSVSSFICTFVRNKSGWEGMQIIEPDVNYDAKNADAPIDKNSAEYKEADAALREFMQQLHLPSPVLFLELSRRTSHHSHDDEVDFDDDLSPDEEDMDSDYDEDDEDIVDELDYDDEFDNDDVDVDDVDEVDDVDWDD